MSALAILALLVGLAALDYSVRKDRSIISQLDKEFQTQSKSYKEFRSRS